MPIFCCSPALVQLRPVALQHVPSPSVLHPPTTGNVIEMQLRVPLLASPLVTHLVPLGMRHLQAPLHLKLKHVQLPVMRQPLVQLVAWKQLTMILNQDVQLSHLTLLHPLGQVVVLKGQTTLTICLQLDMVRIVANYSLERTAVIHCHW